MKKLLFAMALFGILIPNTFVLAQSKEDSLTAFPNAGSESSDPSGNVSCFDYYKFGSVQADLQPKMAQTVPGVDVYFQGKVKNENDYPLVDGTLYIKIFRKDDVTFKEGNGNALVDQFPLEETFTLPAKGEKDASFTWRVPENAPGGEYYAATFFATENRYNLLGLSFTDDVVGNQGQFTVTSSNTLPAAFFSKNNTTLNGRTHAYAAFPLHFKKDEAITVKVKVVNSDTNPKVVPIMWKEYAWDALRKENQRNQKTEFVELGGSETKEVSYTVKPSNDAVTYLVAETKDQNLKSFLDIRMVRDGVAETRINFPSLLKFPLVTGEENALFACAHSTNEDKVKGNILSLTLRDENQNVIHEYKYEGDITGAMGGWKDSFTPEKFFSKVSLTATLQREGQVVEEVTIDYDCKQIDEALCKEPSKIFGGGATVKKTAIIVGVLLSLIAILAICLSKMKSQKRGNRFKVLFFALLLGGSFMGGVGEVEAAKNVSWSSGPSPQLNYCWNRPFSSPAPGTDVQPKVCNTVVQYGGNLNWEKALSGATATVQYTALVTNTSTGGNQISDGASLPTGTQIQLRTAPHGPSDVSWFGTGFSQDSPNGEWRSGATAPSWVSQTYGNLFSGGVTANGPECNPKDRITSKDPSTYPRVDEIYVPLVLDPPMGKNTSVSGNLSCGGPSVDGSGTLVQDCTVTSAGPISVTFNIPSTYGKYYYRYHDEGGITGDPFSGMFIIDDGCYNNDNALRTASAYNGTSVKQNALGGEYQVNVPPQAISFNFTGVSSNNAPTPPTIVGATSGTTGTQYYFDFTGTDPDGDQITYGIDLDMNGTDDTGSPYGTPVPSGTTQNIHVGSWPTAGPHTIQARTYDTKGGVSGWTQHTITLVTVVNGICGAAQGIPTTTTPTFLCNAGTPTPVTGGSPTQWDWTCVGSGGGSTATCNAPYLTPAPVVDIKINGSDGPITVSRNGNLNITWGNIPDATTCTGTGNNWNGGKTTTGGNDNLPATAASLYQLSCTGPGGTTTDSVSVTLANTLKICQNSCSSGIEPPASFAMIQGTSNNYVSCFNDATSCTDPTGNVSSSTTWNEGGGASISLTNTDPKTVTANTSGTETFSADYSSQNQTKTVTVTCTDAGACSRDGRTGSLCQTDTFTVVDNCGVTQSCTGTKTCDYNWKEVAP